MNVKEAIRKRRAYRSLDPVEISDDLIQDLAECAQLFCSCFNNQPWQYVFVRDTETLKKMHEALSRGNEWARAASMIIAVFSKPEADCMIKGRNYYLFDTGMATAAIILRATELGLVAHPIAGYSPRKAREILGIPGDTEVITLVIVGKHSDTVSPVLSDKQIQAEKKRPERKPLQSFVHIDTYKGKM
ncbi:nitroreductase [candidate division WOR_3 bacterium SM23_60]|uniref:Nitroreductase n=1 Tax=candidate division WOR_3 bacterium SM23_60 TaxID=1703780 RepID=A0A0S8GI15_UNCW3|nr:MAG: nitroreductase [candidate division WOR_3 bacterium SM23_60]